MENEKKFLGLNNKGFSLIELLGAVTVMGILMLVAVVGITRVIENSRKGVYINNAKTYVKSLKNDMVNERFKFNDPDVTYYVHVNNIDLENDVKSPWGDWEDAYVVLGYVEDADDHYIYAWASKDMAGWRVNLKLADELEKKDVYNDKLRDLNYRAPLGDRSKITIIDKDGKTIHSTPVIEVTKPEADRCYSYTFIEDHKSIKITWYKKECGTDVSIPGMIDGFYVKEIHSYAFNNMGLTSVIIPGTVKTIGSRAFAYNNLTSVTLPEGLDKIDSEAFLSNKLPNVDLPETLTSLGARSFKTNQLTTYHIPDATTFIGACCFCNNPIDNPSFLYVNGDNSAIRGYIGDMSEFSDKKFIIPAVKDGTALKTIKSSAFASMSLTNWEVVIPDTVTVIESSAFNASGVGKVNLPSGLKTIGSSAFYNNRITELSIPASVTSIGTLAFNCNYVAGGDDLFVYKRTNSGIDYSTVIGYSGKNRKNVSLPSESHGVTLKTIASSAFEYLSMTGGFIIPDTVKSVGSQAFTLNKLTWIDNGDGDRSGPFVYKRKADGSIDKTSLLGYAAYQTAHVDVPSQVKRIENYAFYYTYIKSINIPEGVTYIGSNAFNLCWLEGTVVIPSTVTSIGANAFKKEKTWATNNTNLVEIVNKTGRAFNWQSITAGSEPANFITGTAQNWYGDIQITAPTPGT